MGSCLLFSNFLTLERYHTAQSNTLGKSTSAIKLRSLGYMWLLYYNTGFRQNKL